MNTIFCLNTVFVANQSDGSAASDVERLVSDAQSTRVSTTELLELPNDMGRDRKISNTQGYRINHHMKVENELPDFQE